MRNPMKYVLSLVFCLTLALPASAQIITSVSSGCQCQKATQTFQPEAPNPKQGPQTICTLNMSIPVTLTGPSRVRFSYSIFGDALGPHHDGVNAWISITSNPKLYIATGALEPKAVFSNGQGGSWVGNAQDIDFPSAETFTAQVNVAFEHEKNESGEEWGCLVPKIPSPSFLSVEIIPMK
jgi:hypothetical protein